MFFSSGVNYQSDLLNCFQLRIMLFIDKQDGVSFDRMDQHAQQVHGLTTWITILKNEFLPPNLESKAVQIKKKKKPLNIYTQM